MLNLVRAEFIKLKRKRSVWFMLLASWIMPILSTIYFYDTDISNDSMKYFKWTMLSYNLWLILPTLLGVFATMIVNVESEYGVFKNLWLIPLGKLKLLFSKFLTLVIYSFMFMCLSTLLTIVLGITIHKISFQSEMYSFLIHKCLEISVFTSISMFPILSIAFLQNRYLLPICLSIVYAFSGFILLMVNMYVHPLSSVTAIVLRGVSKVILPEEINIIKAIFCISIWVVASMGITIHLLKRRDW